MKRTTLYFTAPRQVEVREEPLPHGESGQLLIESQVSAISPGTEMLIYRGQAPAEMAADTGIKALAGNLSFPLKYGYCLVGRVIDGRDVDLSAWQDRWVFAFHPHESHFWARPEELYPLPSGMSPETGVFLPNMETAVNFLHDGQPLFGEQVVVFGQGVIGLLTTSLLARLPLASLVTVDGYSMRRSLSLQIDADVSLDPADPDLAQQIAIHLCQHDHKADLVYELSGAPAALQQAIDITGYDGRVVLGSWYGNKAVSLNLGGVFHRDRIRLLGSQVSTIASDLSGRWDKDRRLQTAMHWLSQVEPQQLITHRLPITQAAEAYRLLDEQQDSTVQILLQYHN